MSVGDVDEVGISCILAVPVVEDGVEKSIDAEPNDDEADAAVPKDAAAGAVEPKDEAPNPGGICRAKCAT
eukprot:SAG31_NODE_3464_length_4244_cov_3.817370_5_plen_70_part_00